MFNSLKKIWFLIPCMILGLFLFNGEKTSAREVVLLDADPIYVGSESEENTYYYPESNTLEFRVVGYNIGIPEWDTFLKWRVINPNGKATSWYGSLSDTRYVDYDGKFTISDYKKLNYSENVGLSGRVSVAPLMTYYVEVKYYAHLMWSWEVDVPVDVVKIISVDNNQDATPTLDIEYNKSTNKFSISAGFAKAGYGIITDVEYFFADEAKKVDSSTDFASYKKQSANKGNLLKTPASKGTYSVANVDSASNLYVKVTTGSGHYTIMTYDIISKEVDDPVTDKNENNETAPKNDESEKESGLFDLQFGEIILIILVVVLIVSCALIITQKIVDYKKRLY